MCVTIDSLVECHDVRSSWRVGKALADQLVDVHEVFVGQGVTDEHRALAGQEVDATTIGRAAHTSSNDMSQLVVTMVSTAYRVAS